MDLTKKWEKQSFFLINFSVKRNHFKLYKNEPGGESEVGKDFLFFVFKMLEFMLCLFPPGNEVVKSESLMIWKDRQISKNEAEWNNEVTEGLALL